jgi:hypothetical protein
MRPSKGKKHRKVWIIPKGGTWYVMKKYLDKGRTIGGLRKLIGSGDSRIFFAVIKRMLVPVEKDHLIESIEYEWADEEDHHFRVIINGQHNHIGIPRKGFQITINSYIIASQGCLSGFNNGFSLSSKYLLIRHRRRYTYDGVYAELMTKGV